MKPLFALFVVLCASLAACTDGSDLGPIDDDGTLMARLQSPTALTIDGAASLVAVSAYAHQSEEPTPVEFSIVEGGIDVRADARGDLVVHAFDVALEDVSIGAELFPPDGLELKNLQVRMDYPIAAEPEWTADTASAELTMDITAEWSAVFNGNVYPLRAIELSDLVVRADLTLVDGAVSAQLSAARTGTFWDWANRFEMADLVVEVDARAE